MKDGLEIAVVGIVIVLVLAGVVYAEVAAWTECRATNSWWYCLRILSR